MNTHATSTQKPAAGSLRVLVVDDEALIRWSLKEHLTAQGYDVTIAEDGQRAIESIDASTPDAVLCDMKMPNVDGLGVLQHLRDLPDAPPVIVITAQGSIDSAIEATKLGAAGYLSKPFDLREVSLQLQTVLEKRRMETELRYLRDRQTSGYERLIGAAPSMMKVFDTLRRLERVDAPTVLICGESGTGKDLVAQAIHARGPRKNKPYMEIDCAAMPETLIESELFGHEKGSFTDARTTKKGLFEVADGGVIFLDEIGEMTLGTQAKLLRALENRKFKRVGGVHEIPLNAAIVAATNRDLRAEVKAGRFREDLFFRLHVIPIDVPPLRRRVEDVEPIALALVERVARDLGREIAGISHEALDRMRRYPWPGNVRELRNVVERAVILKQDDGPIRAAELPEEIRASHATSRTSDANATSPYQLLPEGIDLAVVEQAFVEQALERTHGNQTNAAKLLGITRFALRTRMDRYGIKRASMNDDASDSITDGDNNAGSRSRSPRGHAAPSP